MIGEILVSDNSIIRFFRIILFQPLVQPAEEGALPEHAVLWLQHPVVLVGVEEELGGDAAQSGCVEGALSLTAEDAVVLVAVDAEDGSVPAVDVEVGALLEGVVLALGGDIYLFET